MSAEALKGPCWEWLGVMRGKGYGAVTHSGKVKSAHRVAYEAFLGFIPDGMVIDHLCRNSACVNPWHMELVTNAENVRRGVGPSAINYRKTHCAAGHEFTERNTYVLKGHRRCRVCQRDHQRRYLERKAVRVLEAS